ncbi:MAG: cation:proton antiporter [Candidatus Pacearchaeota archaeon]|nr:cation:proton antiporter [Candidatus Pacearchaeota archaeon]
MEQIFIQLAVILLIAFIVSYIVSLFKQPILIGYIIAGVLISPFVIKFGVSTDFITTLSRFGIAFLLFIVGLHLNPKTIKEIGISSLLIGLLQILITFLVSFFIASQLLGFGVLASVYIGISLSFSSTILVMKLLSDKQDLESLYAKISIGVLIVQDLVAAGVLMFISSTSGLTISSGFVLTDLLIGFGLIVLLFLVGFFILPLFTRRIAKSQELLFLFSVCWCFVVAALFNYLGFSIEIGALVAGVSLSMIPYSAEISSRISPLRDFFLIIFFIILGFNANLSNIGSILFNAIILSLVVLILKPVIMMALSAFFGYTKRTNFLVGTSLAQISEFSLIVILLGVSLGQITSEVLHTVILTMILTILISTYMIIYSEKFYEKSKWFAKIFEKKNIKRKQDLLGKEYHAILFGYNRIGFSILNSIKKFSRRYLVVDFNPETISILNRFGIPSLYGDVDDVDFLNELSFDKIEIAVSTVPECETNSVLIDTIRRVNKKAIIIVRAHTIDDALELYRKGANYVLTPHFLGGEYVSKMIGDLKTSESGYEKEKEKHIQMLKDVQRRGEEHPKVERG